MQEKYYFSPEFSREEKRVLAKKAAYYQQLDILPPEVIRPVQFIYNEEKECIGYTFEKPRFPYLSLKDLFSRENIEKYHVDGHLLLTIARKVLFLMSELCEKGIYAGFLGLESILVHAEKPSKALLIARPEYFQAEEIPSSYPWYPSDSRLFEEEFELFDETRQKKADAKLIYKILTASEKGNAKIPPNPKTQEFSSLFWNILSREWKDYFLDLADKEVDYVELMDRISVSIEAEKSYMTPEEKRITDEDGIPIAGDSSSKSLAYACIVILREADKSAHDVSRELYLLQEKMELHPYYEFEQAFVMGDKQPFVRDFKKYPYEFRAQLAHSIKSYSFGEVLLIGAEVLHKALSREERPSVMFVLLDGEIKNDAMFQVSLKHLEVLKARWNTEIKVLPVRELKGEGYARLCEVCE